MKCGVTLPLSGVDGDIHRFVEYACLAEEAGWDGVFLEDYIVYWGGERAATYDPWLALAAVAARTQRIRLGVTVTPLSRRRPWKLAREAVTLDRLSNGRLIVGVGLGDGADPSFTGFGEVTDAKQRAEMLDEALDVIVGLWSGAPFSHQGKHYQIGEVTFLPTPVQRPRIPIWVGGAWPKRGPTRRSARWDGTCMFKDAGPGNFVDMTADDVRAMKADIEQYRAGAAPFDIVLGGKTPGDDPEAARSRLAPLAEAGATWWSEFVMDGGPEAMRERIGQGPPRIG